MEKDIYRTVAYFSLFEYPLTEFEIWQWLLTDQGPVSLAEVKKTLDESSFLSEKLVSYQGFWTIQGERGVKKLVETRHKRFLDAVRKYKRLRRVARYLAWIPSVRAVVACNNLAWDNTRPESDIDIFIIVREGSVWFTRLITVAPFKILGMRPGGRKRDPLCFTFFLSDANLDISSLALKPADPYLVYWTRSLVPVFDRDGAFSEFNEANRWVESYLPNARAKTSHLHRAISARGRTWRAPKFAERFAERLQRQRFPDVIQTMANRDSRVVVSDAMLKFHDNDRRAEYLERLNILCEL